MRKIILNLCLSLDGFIEGPAGEYDWCFTDQDYGMTKFMEQIDAVFCGRKSYELLASVGDEMLIGKKNYVFSRSLQEVKDNWTLVADTSGERVRSIAAEAGKDIWLFGGSDLTSHLLKLKLVDQMILSIHPLILGGGNLLFDIMPSRIPLQLIDSKTYNTGLVQLTYHLQGEKK
ncbi:MAG: dihydrofolate reductase [Saprospiraceae bacterium]|nr:dihydrofolate reductase [Saprospiraceae bacterium]